MVDEVVTADEAAAAAAYLSVSQVSDGVEVGHDELAARVLVDA